jgi:hypothetical protein
MESTTAPTASIQYLCVSDDHVRLGRTVHDGEGHLTVRSGQWAYCSAGRKDEPHEWEAIPATPFAHVRHASIMRRSAHADPSRAGDRDTERSE